jgi:hypothetical protein
MGLLCPQPIHLVPVVQFRDFCQAGIITSSLVECPRRVLCPRRRKPLAAYSEEHRCLLIAQLSADCPTVGRRKENRSWDFSTAFPQPQNAFTRSASLTARSYPALSAGSISAGETKFT